MNDVKKSYWEKILAEAISAILSEVFAYPLHTVWTVQQEGNSSFRHAFKTIGRNANGYRGLYKGFSIAAVTNVIGVFPYLAGADCAIQCFGDNDAGQLMQGPFSQAFGAIVWAPATRMIELEQASITHAANSFKQLSVFDKSKMIWRNSGVRGFYRGVFPQWGINSVNDALGFWLRAKLLKHCFSKDQSKQPGPQLFSTSFGFALGYLLLTPFSAVETRLRIHETNPTAFPDTTFFPAMRTLYKERGVKGFFVGAAASGLYGAASSLPVACSGCFDHK